MVILSVANETPDDISSGVKSIEQKHRGSAKGQSTKPPYTPGKATREPQLPLAQSVSLALK